MGEEGEEAEEGGGGRKDDVRVRVTERGGGWREE